MNLYLRLAWRNVWRHSRRTIIIVLAMGFSLALMMFYDGIVAGFSDAIYGNAVRVLGGNLQVHAAGYREKVDSNPLLPLANDGKVVEVASSQPGVLAAARRIKTGGLLSNREGAFPVSIIGIEPQVETPTSLIAEHVSSGRFLTDSDRDAVLVGRGLAEAMELQVGDRVTLVGSDAHKQNRQRTMTVIGVYDIGLPTNEKSTLYISLGEAQALFDLDNQATEVQVTLEHLGTEAGVLAALVPSLPGYEVESWEQNYPELESALGSKNAVMQIFSIIILVIAGIGILNLLLMAVYERTREIGLLGALGLKPRQVAALFLLEGTLIGVVGTGAGVLIGLVLNGTLGQVGMDYSQFAGVTEYMALISGRIYPTLGLEKLLGRALPVVVIATLAAVAPALESARREPAEALHYV
jgi:ABC-type lipoprotein release transport system permease subunit